MIQLLRVDSKTVINPKMIVQVVILNLNKLRQERGQYNQTQRQQEQMDNKFWQVSIYLKSGSDGYNPQQYTIRFKTESEAQKWIKDKFGGVIITKL